MTSLATKATMDQAWQTAIAQADSLTLPDSLWERPQVKGFTIDGPMSRDLDDAIWIEETGHWFRRAGFGKAYRDWHIRLFVLER